MKKQKRAKSRLTNAWQRYNITLQSVILVIKIPHRGAFIECSTVDEAYELLKRLKADEKKAAIIRKTPGLATFGFGVEFEEMQKAIHGSTETSLWNRELFGTFIDNLGDSQKKVLALLVTRRKATDEEIRKVLKLDGNQALAGVLSGISKQAGIIDI